jgi:hypothetical protein
MREYVRDPAGRTLGFIEDDGRLFGRGNLLSSFLVRR